MSIYFQISHQVTIQVDNIIRNVMNTVILARNDVLPDDDIIMSKHIGVF